LSETASTGEPDWVAARDAAVFALMYGCGLRVSEALSLTGRERELPATLRITGKGEKTRIVPVLPAVAEAVGRYGELCPFDLDAAEPLFRAKRGGPLTPRHVQAAMQTAQPAWAWRIPRRRMPCAMPSRRIFWPMAAICGRSRTCWAMPRFRRRKCMRRWRRRG
jgi:integrase